MGYSTEVWPKWWNFKCVFANFCYCYFKIYNLKCQNPKYCGLLIILRKMAPLLLLKLVVHQISEKYYCQIIKGILSTYFQEKLINSDFICLTMCLTFWMIVICGLIRWFFFSTIFSSTQDMWNVTWVTKKVQFSLYLFC